jgi:mono/diheme cytochrome c family protein
VGRHLRRRTSGGGTSGGGSTGGGTTTGTGGASRNLVGNPVLGAGIFSNSGCGTCHTLKAAGTTGGIDLDAFQPEQQTVIDNVSNGNTGGIPGLQPPADPAMIRNVASYVYCVTHGKTPSNC